jgi:hypothetical protein
VRRPGLRRAFHPGAFHPTEKFTAIRNIFKPFAAHGLRGYRQFSEGDFRTLFEILKSEMEGDPGQFGPVLYFAFCFQ